MTAQRRKTFYFDKTVEVEIDCDDLEEAGYHHEDDCPAKQQPVPGGVAVIGLADAFASLHRQAHPTASPEIFACPDEPCRSLGLELIGYGPPPVVTAKPTTTVQTGGRT